jgi:hypothetical protein
MGRRALTTVGVVVFTLMHGGPALACGGLIGPRGAVNLIRTATLAGYHDGIEHYVTAFQFVGAGGKFGSLVPLPGVPTKVERGGDWTLQRLQREVVPPEPQFRGGFRLASAGVAKEARVLLEARIDALDITVLEGGAAEVGRWAARNGFDLSPDAPEVLEFYARRSPIFMAARFDADAATERGTQQGDGTPIHLTIPTPNPWVPLRILALGKQASEIVDADVFLLTERRPALLPAPAGDAATARPAADGLALVRSERASDALIADLRSDKGMGWIPAEGMWLSYLRLGAPAASLGYDLAVDASGAGDPSYRAAGFPVGLSDAAPTTPNPTLLAVALGVALLVAAGFAVGRGLAAA